MKTATIAGIAFLLASPAFAEGVTCADFQRSQNGWSPRTPITISSPNGQVSVGPGVSFSRGVVFGGVDLAAMLDQACGVGGGQ